jgi:hypothetical protein
VSTERRRADERIARLSSLSAGRTRDAYTDIAWDDPEMAVSLDDVRLGVPAFDPLSSTEWYQALVPTERARAAAWKLAANLKTGWHFETLLQQALLHRALYLRPGAAEFRYLHHEVVEESQHTLMFNELVNRFGVPVRGMPWWLRRVAEMAVPTLAKHDAPAFFVLVLTGEEPIDRYQRRSIAEGIDHPLVAAIMRTHVAEEARHVSFAKASLQRDVAKLGWVRRQLLGIHAALSFWYVARLMLVPPREMAEAFGIPHRTLTEPYRGPAGRQFFADAVSKPRALLTELGVISGPAALVWRALGLQPSTS